MAFMTKDEYEAYVTEHASNVVSTVFSVYDCILARDRRMYDSNGGWFGLFETPTILSNSGKRKLDANLPVDYSSYGRKENEEVIV